MKNETLLKRLTELYKTMDADTVECIEKALAKNAIPAGTGIFVWECAALIRDIKEEIRQETAKASGKGTQRKALQRILNHAKTGCYGKDYMLFPWIQNGKQWFCSGHHIVGLNEPMDWEKYPMQIDYPQADRLIIKSSTPIELPDIAALKAYIKIQKAQKVKKIKYSFGFKVFDAQLLLDVMEALPGAKAYDNGNKYHGMYLESEDGVAMLLPVRPEPGDEIPTVLN